MQSAAKRREQELQMEMFAVYQSGVLAKMDPKKFPRRFTDFWKPARKETQMSDAQKWANMTSFLGSAGKKDS